MNEMLKEVYGRRFRVDQPSQTVETFDEMRYHFSTEWEKNATHIDNLQCYFLKHHHLFVDSASNTGLVGNVFILDLVI